VAAALQPGTAQDRRLGVGGANHDVRTLDRALGRRCHRAACRLDDLACGKILQRLLYRRQQLVHAQMAPDGDFVQ